MGPPPRRMRWHCPQRGPQTSDSCPLRASWDSRRCWRRGFQGSRPGGPQGRLSGGRRHPRQERQRQRLCSAVSTWRSPALPIQRRAQNPLERVRAPPGRCSAGTTPQRGPGRDTGRAEGRTCQRRVRSGPGLVARRCAPGNNVCQPGHSRSHAASRSHPFQGSQQEEEVKRRHEGRPPLHALSDERGHEQEPGRHRPGDEDPHGSGHSRGGESRQCRRVPLRDAGCPRIESSAGAPR